MLFLSVCLLALPLTIYCAHRLPMQGSGKSRCARNRPSWRAALPQTLLRSSLAGLVRLKQRAAGPQRPQSPPLSLLAQSRLSLRKR